ncbi:MAG: acetyl-CoA acetyltransferase [Burkholderiaceae bacterium]|nr:acetyl-CoA acetyltransferase [Burkholderiaceae bacterium]
MDETRIPVLVGCGQVSQREADPRAALQPLDLMAQAARQAADDSGAGPALLRALDNVTVIRLFADTSPRFACPFGGSSNPPASVAARIGAAQARQLAYTHPGGNMPQWCLNRLGEAIARGELQSALVVGAEALATQKAAQRAKIALDWREVPGGTHETWGVARRGWSDLEERHGARAAITMYPMFENAIRGRLGRGIAEHQAAMGTLLARFAAVAAANPLADRRAGYSAEQIATPGSGNPTIAFPYTRLMSANAYIDQGAALIVTSLAQARALGIPAERRVFLHGCADAHDHWHVTERRDFHSSAAMPEVFAQALEMAGVTLADLDVFDIYSCFASAVEVACSALGLAEDDPRGLTVTGGLPYFGGPGNNYVTHSIAEMMQRLRAAPGRKGLVTANGNYLTKHSAGVYSTEPPARPFAPQDPAILQAKLDAVPHPPLVELADGEASIETYTVVHDARGPTGAVVIGRLAGGERFIANTPADAALLAEMQQQDFLGRAGRVRNDGERNSFVPG